MRSASPRIFILAGEASGDVHAALLMQQLRALSHDCTFCGVGGETMRGIGMDCWIEMERLQLMGFAEIVKALPRIYRQFRLIKQRLLAEPPDAVVLVDYPGFNLRLAKSLRKSGFTAPIYQLISPTVWAWKKGRVATVADSMSHLFTIFPFEAQYYAHTQLPVTYIGHPLIAEVEHAPHPTDWKRQIGADNQSVISVFPGSRAGEIKHNLPTQLQAARQWCEAAPHRTCLVSVARESSRSNIETIVQKMMPEAKLVNGTDRYSMMQNSDLAIATSGTVTLELALHKVPTTVTYHVSWLNKLIAGLIFRLSLPFYCIVNILKGREIFPEWIRSFPTPDQLESSLNAIEHRRSDVIQACSEIWSQLSDGCGMSGAARIILEGAHDRS